MPRSASLLYVFIICVLAAAQTPAVPAAPAPDSLAAEALNSTATSTLKLYDQCGGKSKCEAYKCIDAVWPGVSCPGGSTCQRKHEWYWQCRPGTSAAAPPTTTAAPTTARADTIGLPPSNTTSASLLPPTNATIAPPPSEMPTVSPAVLPENATPAGAALSPQPPLTFEVPGAPPAAAAAPLGGEANATPQLPSVTVTQQPPGTATTSAPTGTVLPAVRPAVDTTTQPPSTPNASTTNAAAVAAPAPVQPPGAPPIIVNALCPPYTDTQKHRTTNFTDTLATTVSVSPLRPTADRPRGAWIPGRATYYATSQKNEAAHVQCGEPAGQFGVLAQGACGFTNGDGSLVYPQAAYAANADANEDYPGSCGRCYQVRCKSGVPENNGRPLRISDLIYYRPLEFLTDDQGRTWPGNPELEQDLFYVRCWDDSATITIRVADSCPCKYNIKETGEIRTQNWCCGGQNHFDLSYWAFQELAHPVYGVMPLEYRPVDCATNQPLDPIPGFVSKAIYSDDLLPGWGWRTYDAKNTVLLDRGQGLGGATAVCGTLSKDGAMGFFCRECTRPGYQPFAGARSLQFWIRSNTPAGADPFASSTPAGQLPGLKIFLSQDGADPGRYCGAEVILGNTTQSEDKSGDWYYFSIPLAAWRCSEGSVGGLAGVDRVDFQNVEIRDADVCLDDIALV